MHLEPETQTEVVFDHLDSVYDSSLTHMCDANIRVDIVDVVYHDIDTDVDIYINDLHDGGRLIDNSLTYDDYLHVYGVDSIHWEKRNDEGIVVASEFAGAAIARSLCEFVVAFVEDAGKQDILFAHEFGHVLGLEHRDDEPHNIMYPGLINGDASFDEAQLYEMRDVLVRKNRECWNPAPTY